MVDSYLWSLPNVWFDKDAFVVFGLCFFLERHINQLQRCLDKLKKEQTDGEQAVGEQIAELENKNDV